MQIDWTAIGTVFGVSLAATVALVGLFALGTVGLARRGGAPRAGGQGALLATGAYACFALCAAAVAYGIYLIAG
ncbi:hypothetical protein [Streptomyces sp. NPDC050560]|uniref:hypothetical protein n=1 Tax=Streptomyces sp. NPDC050560 TaxID=3365630 RepID=UPI0037A82ECE